MTDSHPLPADSTSRYLPKSAAGAKTHLTEYDSALGNLAMTAPQSASRRSYSPVRANAIPGTSR